MTAALVVLLFTAFGNVTPARAETPRPGASSVDQYVELIPTATGPKAPGVEEERRLPLSPRATRSLDGVSKTTAAVLVNVATSSTYGAPTRPGSRASGIVRDTRTTARSPSGGQSAEAIAAAVAPAGDARMIALLLTLAVVTVAAAALTLRRRL